MTSVLLAEDQGLVREGIRKILEGAGEYDIVGEASTGEEAVRLTLHLRPDIVFMDLHMPPGYGGIEATRRILRTCPETRVIALTIFTDNPYPIQIFDAGAMGYITKACTAQELFEAIKSVQAGKRYLGSTINSEDIIDTLLNKPGSPFVRLSERELQVVQMILDGYKTQDISDSLSVSPKTVATYRQRIYSKLGISTELELIKLAICYQVIEWFT